MNNQDAAGSPPAAIRRDGFPKGVLSPSSHAPINEIPPELLLTIFDEDLKLIGKAEYYNRLYDLMLVSSSWANLIKDTPQLWSFSFAKDPHPERLPLILQRSDSAPLTIENHTMGPRSDFDDALFKEIHRWQSVEIVQSPLDGKGDLQHRLESSAAPFLKKFRAVGWKDLSLSIPAKNLFGGQAPQLESLSLTRFPVLFDSPIFNSLRTLKLENIDLGYLTFFDMVKRFKFLAVLELTNATFHELPQHGAQPIIVLPNLTSFRIESLRKGDADWLLRTFRMPRCTNIAIVDFKAELLEGLPTRKTLPHLIETFKSALANADRLTMSVSEDEYRVTASRAGRNVFDFHGTMGEEALPALEFATTEWELAKLHIPTQIRLNFQGSDFEPLLRTLSTLPYIETIVMFQIDESVVYAILGHLCCPLPDPSGVHRWCCPKLESLLCYQCGTSSDAPPAFKKMLKHRYGGQEGKVVERPKRLRYLYITPCESDDSYSRRVFRKLWEMLEPEGKLRWNPRVAEPNLWLKDNDGEPRGDDVPDHTTFDEEYVWLKDPDNEDEEEEEEWSDDDD